MAWLQKLPDHPIFSRGPIRPQDAGRNGSDFRGPNMSDDLPPSPGASTIREDGSEESSGSDQYTDEYPESSRIHGLNRVMAVVRETELWVAVGRQVRTTSLVDFKSRCESVKASQAAHGATYKILDTPNVTFEVRAIVPSPASRAVALVGNGHLAVVNVPRRAHTGSNRRPIECRCAGNILVGPLTYTGKSSPKIVDVRWHPLSIDGHILLVLSADGKVREFDLSVDAEEPQQTLDFVPNLSTTAFCSSNSFSPDDDEVIPAALCFGKGRGDWGPLTIYCVMESGDIFAMCPYLPRNAVLPNEYIASLANFVRFKLSESSTSGSPRSKSKSPHHLTEQSRFVRALANSDSQSEQLPTDHSRISPTSDVFRHKASLQGPLRLSPASPSLSDKISIASDICYVDRSPLEDGSLSGVFLVAYSDGKVDVCLLLERLEARWGCASGEPPMLILYETIDLDLNREMDVLVKTSVDAEGSFAPRIVLDPTNSNRTYIHHLYGVHVVDRTPWSSKLRADDPTAVASSLSQSPGSDVHWIIRASDYDTFSPIAAFEIIDDAYLGYFLLAVTDGFAPIGLELRPTIPLPVPNTSVPTSPTTSLVSEDGKPAIYQSIIASNTFEIPQVLANRRRPPTVKPTAAHRTKEISLETLKLIADDSTAVRKSVRDLVVGVNSVQGRISLQMDELSRQLRALGDLVDRLDRKNSKASYQSRLDRVSQTQDQICSRLDRILQRAMDRNQRQISPLERKWFNELERIKGEVDRSQTRRTIRARFESARDQFAVLEPEVRKLGHWRDEDRAPQRLGEGQLDVISAQLAKEARRIEAASLKVDEVKSAIEKMDLAVA